MVSYEGVEGKGREVRGAALQLLPYRLCAILGLLPSEQRVLRFRLAPS
jgi:hypothetical protein